MFQVIAMLRHSTSISSPFVSQSFYAQYGSLCGYPSPLKLTINQRESQASFVYPDYHHLNTSLPEEMKFPREKSVSTLDQAQLGLSGCFYSGSCSTVNPAKWYFTWRFSGKKPLQRCWQSPAMAMLLFFLFVEVRKQVCPPSLLLCESLTVTSTPDFLSKTDRRFRELRCTLESTYCTLALLKFRPGKVHS